MVKEAAEAKKQQDTMDLVKTAAADKRVQQDRAKSAQETKTAAGIGLNAAERGEGAIANKALSVGGGTGKVSQGLEGLSTDVLGAAVSELNLLGGSGGQTDIGANAGLSSGSEGVQ